MDIPANVPWQEPLPNSRPVYMFRRAPQPNTSLTILSLIGILLLFPSLLTLAGGMAGIPVRDEPQTFLCNSGLAVTGGALLIWSWLKRAGQKSAGNLRLILDETGIGESGYADSQKDWHIAWDQLQNVVLTGNEGERVLRLYTLEDTNRPAYLLFDYPFEEFVPEIAERLSAVGKQLVISV